MKRSVARIGVYFLMFAILVFSREALSATYVVSVTPQGDAAFRHYHDKWGGFNWWEENQNPNSTYYWYDGPPAQVDYSKTYLQFYIGDLAGQTLNHASLNLNILGAGSSWTYAATLWHRTDSSSATGYATQGLGGDTLVYSFPANQTIGWFSLDVTTFLQNDIANGYNWSCWSFATYSEGGYGGSGISFGSGEDPSNAPYLLAQTAGNPDPVPVPSTILLMATGFFTLGGGCWVRRRLIG